MKTYELPKEATCKVETEDKEGNRQREDITYYKMDWFYWYFEDKDWNVIPIRWSVDRKNKDWFYYLQ